MVVVAHTALDLPTDQPGQLLLLLWAFKRQIGTWKGAIKAKLRHSLGKVYSEHLYRRESNLKPGLL